MDNVVFVSENEVLFIIGRHVASYHTERGTMGFMTKNRPPNDVVALAVSQNAKYLALSESRTDNDAAGNARVNCSHTEAFFLMGITGVDLSHQA
jgi:hypothetical protein